MSRMSALDQKNVKFKINQNLAHVVKELQKQYPSGATVMSEALAAQCLCSIIEAAFIHGLKPAYFDKSSGRSKHELPKPQFWNIILKISHTETVKRVNSMKYISSKIGKCRSWLRLAMNDSAVTSYLQVLLSKERKSLRTSCYYNYALFLDEENSDIFLRHLTGVEVLPFDLSYNSSMLNDWTRSPLELAGLIPPSSSIPLYMTIKSRPDNDHSPVRRFVSQHRGSAPAILSRDSYSKSLPSVSAEEWSKKHGTDSGKESSPTIYESILEETEGNGEDSVLHERRLLKKRRKKSINGIKGSLNSLCSSPSTPNSGSSPSPRTGSFVEIPHVITLQKRASAMSEKPISLSKKGAVSKPINFDTNNEISTRKTDSDLDSNKNKISSSSDDDKLEFKRFPMQDESSCSPVGDTTDNGTSNSGLSSKSSPDLDNRMPVENIQNNPKISHSTPARSQNIDKTTESGSENPDESAEAIDIYSSSYRYEPTTTPNLSTSFGNSLSRQGGWSVPSLVDSDERSNVSPNKSNSELESVSHNALSSVEEAHEPIKWATQEILSEKMKKSVAMEKEVPPEIFIRREGDLKKLGETLKRWNLRWFVLRGKELTYHKDKDTPEPVGSIDLTEVATISENKPDHGAHFMLTMKNGVKHHFKSESKTLSSDWATDIKLMITGARLPEVQLEPYIDIYATSYIEEYEIITVADPIFKAPNPHTSWRASMVALLGKMPNEKGLDSQCYQCADCASPIGIIHGAPRVCGYTGQYYCSQCHINEETQIPARMVKNWDFRKYKVAKRSKSFLEQVFSEPHLNISDVNPGIYKYIDEMGKVHKLRQRFIALKSYLQTCRSFDMEAVTKKLASRPHFLEDCHLYSVQDLCNVHDKSLANDLTKIVNNGTKHVYGCSLCSAKGFVCEVCKNDNLIFPFEVDTTVQCFECKGVFHRDCKNETCPRCDRKQRRLQKEMELPSPDESDSD